MPIKLLFVSTLKLVTCYAVPLAQKRIVFFNTMLFTWHTSSLVYINLVWPFLRQMIPKKIIGYSLVPEGMLHIRVEGIRFVKQILNVALD